MGEEGFLVLPDNWTAFEAFNSLGTQWRVGFAGAIGLDYGVIPDVLKLQQIPETDWRDVFDSIRVMERVALEVMNRKD